jgi:hypothetical protein
MTIPLQEYTSVYAYYGTKRRDILARVMSRALYWSSESNYGCVRGRRIFEQKLTCLLNLDFIKIVISTELLSSPCLSSTKEYSFYLELV